jgi:hypothetical protein
VAWPQVLRGRKQQAKSGHQLVKRNISVFIGGLHARKKITVKYAGQHHLMLHHPLLVLLPNMD